MGKNFANRRSGMTVNGINSDKYKKCIEDLTLSGQPITENGHNALENQVSNTSSSCSSVKAESPARIFARSLACSIVRATIQF
jgi:hypothetical protein